MSAAAPPAERTRAREGRFRFLGLSLSTFTLANLICQVGIVLTGGAVRLTGSGLGCPTVPACTDEDFFPTPELEIHGIIEFANRGLGYLVGIVAIVTFVAIWRSRRRGLYAPAAAVAVGVALQGGLGMVTVLTGLNPWTVLGHFLVSMVLVSTATWLHLRAAHPEGPAPEDGPPAQRAPADVRVATAIIGPLLAVVLVLGTLTTGTGPHSGDSDITDRMPFDLELISKLHSFPVYVLILLTAFVAIWRRPAPRAVTRAARVLLAAELLQGAIGLVQYVTDLPIALVAAHMLGAALLVVAATRLWWAVFAQHRAAVPKATAEH